MTRGLVESQIHQAIYALSHFSIESAAQVMEIEARVNAMEVEIDKQGRVVLPEYLRRYAKLSKDVVVAGLYGRIEVWDTAAWESYRAKIEKYSNDIAEQMGALGV